MSDGRTESRTPRILEAAPAFEARSPHGVIRIERITLGGKTGRATEFEGLNDDKVIVPAPSTLADAAKRTDGGRVGLDVQSWYRSKKELAVAAR